MQELNDSDREIKHLIKFNTCIKYTREKKQTKTPKKPTPKPISSYTHVNEH